LRSPPRRLTVKIWRVTGSAGGSWYRPGELAGGVIALAGVALAGSRPHARRSRAREAREAGEVARHGNGWPFGRNKKISLAGG